MKKSYIKYGGLYYCVKSHAFNNADAGKVIAVQ